MVCSCDFGKSIIIPTKRLLWIKVLFSLSLPQSDFLYTYIILPKTNHFLTKYYFSLLIYILVFILIKYVIIAE